MRHLTPLLFAASIVLSTAPAQAVLVDQLVKLLADDGEAGEHFGYSCAISGNIVIVGAHLDDDNGWGSGSAYLFDATTGKQITKLLATNGVGSAHFGWSVDISGNTAIIGAVFDGFNGAFAGAAYLFDTTTGKQMAKLLPSDGVFSDYFGWSVGVSGVFAIIGAPFENGNGAESGSAYLFGSNNGIQINKLLANDGAWFDNFGISVAINGAPGKEIVIIGAYQDDDCGTNSGSAYLFDALTGQQIKKLIANDGAEFDHFGSSVGTNGTIAIIGADGDDDNGPDSGSAYLFDITTGQQLAKLLPNDGETLDRFGRSVGISNEIAIVGAFADDNNNGFSSGSAYLFDITTGKQIAKLISNDGETGDEFGRAVAIRGISGDEVAIAGAWRDNDNGTDSGSAYLFDISNIVTCPWDLDSDESVGTSDLLALFAQWGTAGSADFNKDGIVNTADLLILFANWGPCP